MVIGLEDVVVFVDLIGEVIDGSVWFNGFEV